MKISINKKSFYINFIFFSFFPLSFLSETFGARNILEGAMLLLLLPYLKNRSLLGLLFILTVSFVLHGPIGFIASTSVIYYLFYAQVIGDRAIEINRYNAFGCIFFYLFYDFILDPSNYYRRDSFLNSPLAAGYLMGGFFIYSLMSTKFSVLISAVVGGLLTGSRSFILLFISGVSVKWKAAMAFAFMTIPVAIFYLSKLEDTIYYSAITRATSSNSRSEAGRLRSYIDWINHDWAWHDVFLGAGRQNFGSLGLRLGNENANVVESSFLTIIGSYGVFGLLLFLIITLRTLKRFDIVWIAVFLLSSITVFMDALAVVIPTLLLISTGINNKNNKKVYSHVA